MAEPSLNFRFILARHRPALRLTFGVCLLAVGLASCSSTSEGDTAGPGVGGGGAGGSGAGGTGNGGTAATSSGGNGGVVIGGGSGGGDGSTKSGCEKIDFLFIVDNSVSMENEQSQLVAAFPGFISTIESTVNAGSNYHVMVADTDEWGRCNTANPWTGIDPSSTTCNAYIKSTVFQECDKALGGGVIHPAGQYASNKICPIPDGRRYLVQGDPNVDTTFGCMAQVGVAGHSSERPMDALLAAVSPALNGPGGCNEGFLRDDALLAITFISDDPNYEDAGTPQSWYDAVVAAKKGDPKAVAVVGFTPAFPDCQPGKPPPKGAHWAEFVAKFPYNLHADVCSGDYASVFAQAVKVIDDSCDQYVPPVN